MLARDPGSYPHALLFAHQRRLPASFFPPLSSILFSPSHSRVVALFPQTRTKLPAALLAPRPALLLQPHILAATNSEIYAPHTTSAPPHTTFALLLRVRVGSGRYGSNSLRACS